MTASGPRFVDEDDGREAAPFLTALPGAEAEALSPMLPRGPMLLDAEPDAQERLRLDWEPALIVAPRPVRGTAHWIAGGIGVLFATWMGLSLARFVLGVFVWSQGVGILGATAIVAGLASVAYGVGLEWRAYRSLEATERLRAILAGNELPIGTVRTASLAWARRVAPGASIDIGPIEAGVQAAATVAEIRAVLRSKLLDRLREAAMQIGKRAATEASLFVAICPHPALDGLAVSLRSLLMMRRIAALYAIRPGMAVTIALMRRVALTSAVTSGVTLVSARFAEHMLGNMPVLKHVAAAIPGASAAALRICRLAGITADACCPIRNES